MIQTLSNSIKRNQLLEIIYISRNGEITKRRIKAFKNNSDSFAACCFLRRSKRTFKLDNVLALVPVYDNRAVI